MKAYAIQAGREVRHGDGHFSPMMPCQNSALSPAASKMKWPSPVKYVTAIREIRQTAVAR